MAACSASVRTAYLPGLPDHFRRGSTWGQLGPKAVTTQRGGDLLPFVFSLSGNSICTWPARTGRTAVNGQKCAISCAVDEKTHRAIQRMTSDTVHRSMHNKYSSKLYILRSNTANESRPHALHFPKVSQIPECHANIVAMFRPHPARSAPAPAATAGLRGPRAQNGPRRRSRVRAVAAHGARSPRRPAPLLPAPRPVASLSACDKRTPLLRPASAGPNHARHPAISPCWPYRIPGPCAYRRPCKPRRPLCARRLPTPPPRTFSRPPSRPALRARPAAAPPELKPASR